MPSGGVTWVDKTLFRRAKALPPAVLAMVDKVLDYEANAAQNFMRDNAPWTDQTANARQGLFAKSGSDASKRFIVLYHTMPYGIWLEVKQSGKYKIIMPATEEAGRQVMSSLKKILAVV